ncbi:MAG: PadR family transcriptional regulator [Candidatus Omnitrophica bacterium]|nr:PadR family transcriptional regulator [Candidatus Omnitrophota bacterium]
MFEQEIILLGLLKERPRHGYEIKKQIKQLLFLFAGVDLKSIYYPLRVLENKGLVEKRMMKSGRRPTRYIYRLTPKGEMRFQDLLTHSFLSFKRPQFSLDLSLYFLRYVQPKIAKRRLRARVLILKKLLRELRQTANSLRQKKAYALVLISEHNLRMIEAEIRFLLSLIQKPEFFKK